MLPYDELVELCHAQYEVPKPLALFRVAVAMMYCALALKLALAPVFPKWAAARTASPASCDWRGWDGAALLLSYHTMTTPVGLPISAACPALLQEVVPVGTP